MICIFMKASCLHLSCVGAPGLAAAERAYAEVKISLRDYVIINWPCDRCRLNIMSKELRGHDLTSYKFQVLAKINHIISLEI